MNWIGHKDSVTEANPEDLKSFSKTKQVEVELNTDGLQCLDYNVLLLMIVFKYAEALIKKLRNLLLRGRSCH